MGDSSDYQQTGLDRRALSAVRSGRAGQYLIHAGKRPNELYHLEKGWALQFRYLPDGRRHIIDYFIPGDWCDIAVLQAGEPVDAVRAVTDYAVIVCGADRVRSAIGRDCRLAAQFQSMLSRRLRMQTERALSLGRKTATERIAHLLCEIFARMRAAGRTEGSECPMPLTQTDLADLTGLTPIHVNRVLQQLRAAEMICLAGKRLTVTSPERLQRLAMFSDDYLHPGDLFDPGAGCAGPSMSGSGASWMEPGVSRAS